jgi:hypothetical protein
MARSDSAGCVFMLLVGGLCLFWFAVGVAVGLVIG